MSQFTSRFSHWLIKLGDEYARKIFEMVGGFPLALYHVGVYTFRMGYSFQKCAQELKADIQPVFPERDESKDDDTPYLGTIWKLSFSELRKCAAKMLYLFSFIGNDIPLTMLKRVESNIMMHCMTGKRISMFDCQTD
jgi:hypothetical protein